MASPEQSASNLSSISFADLPFELREQIYSLAMERSKKRFTPNDRLPKTIRSLAHTSYSVRQETMAMYYSHTTLRLTVSNLGTDDFYHDLSRHADLQKWVRSWGVLALAHIHSLDIDVIEGRKGGNYEACVHKMHIDLRNGDKPDSTHCSYWGEHGACFRYSGPQAQSEDVNALVRFLITTLPDGEKVFTPERFEAMMKGLWHSLACVGGSSAPHRFSVISAKSMAYGFAAKSAEEKERVVAELLATDA